MSVRDIFASMDYGPAPESATEALDWIKGHGGRFGCFVDGRFQTEGAVFETRNPATGAVLAEVTQGTGADVEAAVAAARRAFGRWSKT